MSASSIDSESRTGGESVDGGIAGAVARIEPRVEPSPLPGYEHVRGYGVYALPFDTGHVLALRVFPQNDFAPYATVWHLTPDGRWSIYVDGPRVDTACPRYYGAATDHVGFAAITVTWRGPMHLHVEMDAPALELDVRMAAPVAARVLNAIGARLPATLLRTPWIAGALLRVADAVFEVGDVTLIGRMPEGQQAYLLPRQLYPIRAATATLNGLDLGRPTRAAENPSMGDVRFAASPVLAIGEAYFEILDPDEHDRTVASLQSSGGRGA